jgi:hypothetical protein
MGREHVKLFNENKWDAWYASLSPSTKEYLKNQPIWHDSDMWKAGLLGCAIGVLIGLAV